MTLADKIQAKIHAEVEDQIYVKSREIIRERGRMITTEEAYQMGQEKYLPRLIKAQLKDSLKRNDFDTYTLIQNLFSKIQPLKKPHGKISKE